MRLIKSDTTSAKGLDGKPQPANVRSVVRAMDILQSFYDRPLQTLGEVSGATGLDKGTARRLLLTLMSGGFVVQDPATQRYGLGRVIQTLAPKVADDLDIRVAGSPVISDLAVKLRVTAFISVYRNGSAIALERVHDRGFAFQLWDVGVPLPINFGAAPKLLLAYQSSEEIEHVLAAPLAAVTPKSITGPGELRKRLELIKRRAWELAVDDLMVGMAALAVPILDRDGEIICAISISGYTSQMVERGRPKYLREMQRAANLIRVAVGE